MASSSIIRLGPIDDNLSAQLLRNAICSFFKKKNYDRKEEGDDKDDDDDAKCIKNDDNLKGCSRLAIHNKYFNASIILKDIENEQEEDSEKNSVEDGIILVFDAVKSNPDRLNKDRSSVAQSGVTFDSLQYAHQKSLSNNSCGDLLRICVGVSLAELSPSEIRGKDHEKEYSQRILWCLDNGYEYIEADLSEAGTLKGHNDRDKDGFARIIEAIEGTVWSSATMPTSKSNKLKGSFASSKEKIEENECIGTECKGSFLVEENEERKENKYEPPDPPLSTPTAFQNQATEQIRKDVTSIKSDKNDDVGDTKIEDSVASIFGFNEVEGIDAEDINEDKLFVQMESVLKEASQIREASKNGILSDEERRERAGDAALALVNLMGKFGLNNDDDDSDDYGSDDSGIVDISIDMK